MTNKPMSRNLHYLYRRLLRENGEVIDIREILQLYEDHESVRRRVVSGRLMPRSFVGDIAKLKMPKYLLWAKEYLT